MPTLGYIQAVEDRNKAILQKWREMPPEETAGLEPPLLPVPPAELDITVSWPDEWKMAHKARLVATRELLDGRGTYLQDIACALALLDECSLELELDDVEELPLYYDAFFQWLVVEVYDSYLAAFQVKKNGSQPQPE